MKSNKSRSGSIWRTIVGLFYRLEDTENDAGEKNRPAPAAHQQPAPALAPRKTEPEANAENKDTDAAAAEPAKEKHETASSEQLPPFKFPESSGETDEKDIVRPATISASNNQAADSDMPAAPEKIHYPSIVTFKNVCKVFNQGSANEFTALKNISFEIEDLPDIGEFIALVGPSGCGKSTVLNLIQGFQEVGPPTSGEVLVRNRPVTGPGRDRGMIFQKYSSFPHLTVLQNVMFGLLLNRESLGYSEPVMEKLARDMIAKVGMKGHEDKYPYQLSGGQQQRVAIARTLVLKPRIILMDEPFSALDEPTRIEMQELITSLWHEVEATVFIVTHSLAEAVYLSDRIFMFKSNPGRLTRQIMITPDEIGKYPGMKPMEVQESSKFNQYLKTITEEFMEIGGSD